MNGILNFFKPRGMTSHQAVNFLRRKLNIKKIGHTGTLDPSVAGVLPLCIGRATRVSEYLLESDKEYIAEVTLGVATDTYDGDGSVTASSSKKVSRQDIERAFDKYRGQLSQLPPMHSALKHKGKKLYELARAGIEVERKPRIIQVYELDILDIINNEKILFRIKCSKGSYIRSICHDLGMDLGTFGYMSYLIRTESDIFKIEEALGKSTIEEMSLEDIEAALHPMDQGALCFDRLELEDRFFQRLGQGVSLNMKQMDLDYELNQDYRVYCQGKFIGIGRVEVRDDSHYLKMKKVLLV